MANPTIRTIAQAIGVSTATVSKALNDMPDISDSMKERVREAARAHGYTINASARQLASGTSQSVGVVLPDITSDITIEIFRALTTRLERFEYSAHLADSGGNPAREADCVRQLVEHRVRALIVMPCTSDLSSIEETVRGSIPVIYLCGEENAQARNMVICDDFLGGRLAARYLFRAGHRNFAAFNATGGNYLNKLRAFGFSEYIRLNGGNVSLFECEDRQASHEEAGSILARRALASGNTPSAVFASDDHIAAGAVWEFRDAGYRVPEDISIIGYEDMSFSALKLVRLTSVRPPKEELGFSAADMVVDLMNARPDAIRKVLLEPRLIVRGTVRRVV